MFITTRVIFRKVLVELRSPNNSQNTHQASFIKVNLYLRDGGRGRPAARGQACNAQGGHRKREQVSRQRFMSVISAKGNSFHFVLGGAGGGARSARMAAQGGFSGRRGLLSASLPQITCLSFTGFPVST